MKGMKEISLSDLSPGKALTTDLYHESGEVILKRGEKLDITDIQILKRLGITSVLEPTGPEAVKDFVFKTHYRSLPVENLPDGLTLSKPLKNLEKNILIDTGETITAQTKESLKMKGTDVIYVLRNADERGSNNVKRFKAARRVLKRMRDLSLPPESCIKPSPESVSEKAVDRQVAAGGLDVMPEGEALKAAIDETPKTIPRKEQEKKAALKLKSETIKDINELFQMFRSKSALARNGDKVVSLSRNIITELINDKDLLLNSVNLKRDVDYLVQHPVDVTVLAVNIAASLDFSPGQVLEVAYAAFLHDVGMFSVPQSLREKAGPLTQSEFLEVQKHSIYNLDMLQKMRRLPRSTPMVVYQVHERIDKSGYPKHRSANLIHKYAKIIAVADTYSALISKRPYRRAMSPYRAMRMIIDLGASDRLDREVIRAFLQFVCLFPVGSWVKTNTGETGKVIAANMRDYTKPMINILFDKAGKPVNRVVDLANDPETGIVDGLNWDDVRLTADMKGF